MASQIGLLLMSVLLLSKGIDFTSGKKCKFERKYVCGIQDCNCRYVSQNGVSVSSLYRRFLAMFTDNNNDLQVCDKCDVFCSKEKHINCEHGSCDKQKGCICRDCWSGETCSKYHNIRPQFKQSLYVAEIKKDTNVGDEILKVSAIDHDLETCIDKYNCPCGRIKYSINEGNADELFNINPDSGVISLNRILHGQYDPISLTILAKNEAELNTIGDDPSNKALANVAITTVENNDNRQRRRRSLHHRTRRSVTTYDGLIATFEAVTNKTYFSAGCIVPYRLYLAQNSSASPNELTSITIQLSSENLQLPDDGGYSVNISNSNIATSSFNRFNADTVQFSITDPLPNNGYMEIKFNGIVPAASNPLALLQVAFTMNATATGSVTYGPKYSPELYTSYPIIKFARTTEGVVDVETNLTYNVNITLPYFNFTFVFEITTIVNDFRFLSIESVTIDEISHSVQAQNKNPTPMFYTGVEDDITSRVVLDFGKIQVLSSDTNLNTMKLTFSIKANDHELLENSSTHWVGVGANVGEEMLWVGQDSITFSKDEPYLIAEVKTLNNTNPTRYYINDLLKFSWSVKHAENGSYENASDVIVVFYFSKHLKRLDNGSESGFAAPQVTTEAGRTVLTYKYETNDGTLTKGSTLSGKITARVDDTVTPLADLNVEIKIRYKTTKGEDRPIRTYKPNPGYLAGVPSFNLSSNAPDRLVNIGQLVDITVKIVVTKMTLKGKLYAILPVANSSAIMRFVRHESFFVKSYGSNIEAQSLSSSVAIFNSTYNNEYYDRAEIDLGLIENKNDALISSDENTLTLIFKVVLEDNDYVVNKSNYKIGVGVKGSEHMIWISQMTFIANVVPIRRPRLHIEPNSNASDGLVQGSIVEYNFSISHMEHSDAHAMHVEVVWMLPLYTKFLKVNQKSDPLISQVTAGNNVVFKLSKLDFGEKPTVSFSVALDPDKTLTKSGKNYAVTPVALTYKNEEQKIYYEPLVPMSVIFNVPEKRVPRPPNAVAEFYQKGFLIDNSSSAIYICSVSSKRDKPSCFWTDTKGSTWRAVDVMVISIIGINKASKMVYGVGNNMISYMKYKPDKGRWYSISSDQWEQEKSALSDKEIVKIEDGDADNDVPAVEKQKYIENGEKWGATKTGVFHFSDKYTGWKRKAFWNNCH